MAAKRRRRIGRRQPPQRVSHRPGLIRLEQDAAGTTAGAAYLARKRFQQLLNDLLAEDCESLERRIWDRASAAGAEIAAAPHAESRTTAGDITVTRGALLVDRQRFIAIVASGTWTICLRI